MVLSGGSTIKGVSRVKINTHACPLNSRGSPAHFLIEELLEVNEMQIVRDLLVQGSYQFLLGGAR